MSVIKQEGIGGFYQAFLITFSNRLLTHALSPTHNNKQKSQINVLLKVPKAIKF